ncbi:glycosyltransferase [Agilicoccus flavus]|uniref:glycosyltransferase n=1 Tax=Agilicoccus flavus TaxID=2775968 RepID=UPI001CF6550C|nr:glycosyltransferase [Agilicoccus flavus]
MGCDSDPTGARGGTDRRLRVVAALPAYLPAYRGGGPIRTVAAMVARHGDRLDVHVVTGDHDWGERQPLPVPTERWTPVGRAQVWYARAGSAASWWRTWRAVGRLRPDVLYLNGVFPTWTTIAPLAARRLGWRPGQVLLAPRGEFGSGALALRPDKKRVFLVAARLLGLFRGVTWHASTNLEADEIAGVVPGAQIVVHENEVELPELATRAPIPTADDGRLRIVYVGRVADKKGVDVLLEALSGVSTPTRIDVIGAAPDAAYLARCERLAETARTAGHRVDIAGAVRSDRVRSLFSSADVFAFPTAHENFGHTIAEALSVGCPVLLPDTTPWSPVLRSGGGEVVGSREPADWARALQDRARRSPDERRAERARVADAYDAWQAGRNHASVFDLMPHPIDTGRARPSTGRGV